MDTVAFDAVVDAYESRFGKAQFITRKQAAEFYVCSTNAIDRSIRHRKLVTVKTPGGVRIPKASVIQMAEV